MKGMFALAALGWVAVASGVLLDNLWRFPRDTIIRAISYPPGDIKFMEQDYELEPLRRKVVTTKELVMDLYASNVKLSFSSQPQQNLSLRLNDLENLKIEGDLMFPETVISGEYDADVLVYSGKINAHFTGSGDFEMKAQTIVIKIVGTLFLKCEFLVVGFLTVGAIEIPEGADFTATGARLNGIPLSEADVQQTFKDSLPLVSFAARPAFKIALRETIDKALGKEPFSYWNLRNPVDDGNPGDE